MQNNLFSRKNLEDTLKNYQIPEIGNKIEVLQKWVREIKNGGIYGKTESECEQAFNQDIFQNVLDYTKYPELQYTIEPKGSTEVSGQKPDAILGNFNANQQKDNTKNVQAVVEIKDANTSLDVPQKREGHLSPVQQGFKYKPQYEKCVWVIVTNFKEIRLYKDNQITGQSRNLVDLVNPEKDYLNLKFFYYILNAKNFLATPGEKESKTLKSLSEVKNYQKEITNKFYKEYKNLRLTLISDLHKRNSDKEIDFIIQKAQKIIDRIIFIHFCEDLGLLPEGGLENQLKAVGNIAGLTKWDALIGFFKAVDRGSDQLHIPQGYNGGLFKPDSDLDSLLVGDEICEDLVLFGDYDYGEDLTVNILGHIFEQSISDLEKIKLDMLGTKLETEDYGEAEGVSKRKKDGIFYTPEYIVDYIVRNSLGKYLEEKYHKIEKEALKGLKKDAGEKAIQQRDNKIYTEYKKVLENIKVCDPACGSGAFLVKVFDYLLSEHQRVANLLQQDSLFDQNEIYKDILQKNIYGVDLNPESVEITKLSLWLKTANKGKKLTNLDSNIKCGNSLIDAPEVAGEKAFNRQEQFPEVFENGGFDVVVGNPPYVSAPSQVANEEMNKQRESMITSKKWKSLYQKRDLYIPFIELGIRFLCKEKGVCSMIVPYPLTNQLYAKNMREMLLNDYHLLEVADLKGTKIFADAMVTNCIFIVKKEEKTDSLQISKIENEDILPFFKQNRKDLIQDEKTFVWNLTKEKTKSNRSGEMKTIGDLCYVSKGMVLNSDEKTAKGEFSKDDLISKTYDKIHCKEYIEAKDIARYKIKNINFLEYNTDRCPGKLSRPTFPEFYKHSKILFNAIGNINGIYNDSGILHNHSLTGCVLWKDLKGVENKSLKGVVQKFSKFSRKEMENFSENFSLKYILSILNSKYGNDLLKDIRGGGNSIYPEHIRNIPIPEITPEQQKPFIEKADLMLNLNKEFHDELSQTFDFLSQKFNLEKITTKLERFWELDFSVFKKELKIGKITMMEEEDLMKRFENKKKYFESKLAEIDSVDNSIDEMVFDLYGLTKEEREIVRGK